MKLRYRNTFEDLAAFTVHVYSGSPVVTRQPRYAAITAFVVWSLLFAVSALRWDWGEDRLAASVFSLLINLAYGLFLAGIVYFLVRHMMVKQIRRNLRIMYQHQPDKIALGEHELELVDGKLVERNDFAETRWKLSAVEQVVVAPQHVFVFMSQTQAHILPREGLGERELDAFLEELERQRHDPAINPPPVPSSQDIRVDRSSIQQ